ncbi:MAG: hypothetical protein AAHH96_00315 [Candidatus Symbiodolus clandestinus]
MFSLVSILVITGVGCVAARYAKQAWYPSVPKVPDVLTTKKEHLAGLEQSMANIEESLKDKRLSSGTRLNLTGQSKILQKAHQRLAAEIEQIELNELLSQANKLITSNQSQLHKMVRTQQQYRQQASQTLADLGRVSQAIAGAKRRPAVEVSLPSGAKDNQPILSWLSPYLGFFRV